MKCNCEKEIKDCCRQDTCCNECKYEDCHEGCKIWEETEDCTNCKFSEDECIQHTKWTYETDMSSEIWRGDICETREEALEEGKTEAIENGCDRFMIGEAVKPIASIDIDSLIERVQEEMYEEVGEVAEDYLDNVKKEDLEELEEKINEVFLKWQKDHGYEPDFYRIDNEETIELS